jgi:hypothetical protein
LSREVDNSIDVVQSLQPIVPHANIPDDDLVGKSAIRRIEAILGTVDLGIKIVEPANPMAGGS